MGGFNLSQFIEGGGGEASTEAVKSSGPSGGLLSSTKKGSSGGIPALSFHTRYGNLAGSDLFFNWADLDGTDYRKLFGYEFILYDKGKVVMRLALPLNPQNIKINMKHASNLQVTQRGIIEEHNGAPLRPISITGTMGVFNTHVPTLSATNNTSPPKTENAGSFFEKAFKGAFSSTERALKQLNAISSGSSDTKKTLNYFDRSITPATSVSDVEALSEKFQNEVIGGTGSTSAKFAPSGYTYMHMLERFFSYYMAAKKTTKGKSLRLVFAMHKDKMYYQCSFRDMSINKPPGSLEYTYGIQLVAWRRDASLKDISKLHKTDPNFKTKKDMNAIQSLLSSIRKGRRTLAAARNVLGGLRSDVETFTDPIREAGLLLSDLAGVATDLVLLPRTIIKNAEANINAGIAAATGAANQLGDAVKQAQSLNTIGSSTALDLRNKADNATNPNKPSSILGTSDPNDADSKVNQIQRNNTGDEIPSGGELLTLDDIQVSQAIQDQITKETDRILALNADHFRKEKVKMTNYAADISERLGGGSTTYNRINNRGDLSQDVSKLTTGDILLLSEMQQAMQNIDGVISLLDGSEDSQESGYLEFYGDLARQNNLTFEDSSSKRFVPFPSGFTLEQLAYQYLEDDERWIEIAAINGLRSPYIDEVGFTNQLLGSAAGNSLNIANSENLYVGQKIEIHSTTQIPEVRKIKNLDVISSVNTIITVDGDPDLSKFVISDSPYIKAFLPNTVNSNNMIAIPSDTPVTVENKISTSPGVEDIDKIIQIAQTDWLLTTSGDLAMTSSGDVLLSFGLQNIIQASILKTRTKQGDILSYSSFGNPLSAGVNIAVLNASQVLDSLNSMFLDDKRFGSIPISRVRIAGNAAVVDMMVAVTGVDTFLPFTAEIPR